MYFNVVSTASKELKSLFETYIIKNVPSNYSQISEVLSNAMKRSYGPEVRLDLHLDRYSVSSDQMREIITSYKENIVSLYIPLRKDSELLLQPHLEFTNIQRLDISFNYGLHKNICEGIMARYGDKLEHLGVRNLKIPKNTVVLQVPHLSQLKSLVLVTFDNNIVNTFVNSVNKENITYLSLCRIRQDIEQLDNFIFPNLQHLEIVSTSGESALALIKCNKDAITKLNVTNVNFKNRDIGDIKIPNIQYLKLLRIPGDVALSLIKNNKDTITKLKVNNVNFRNSDIEDIKIPNLQFLELFRIPGDNAISFIKNNKDTIKSLKLGKVNFGNSDIEDIKIPNLQFLELLRIPGDFALSLIKNNNDTLFELILRMADFEDISTPVVEMPRLKHLYLQDGDATSELQFIKAFGRNIEELRSYDNRKQTYVNGDPPQPIRKSREELNILKTVALALQ